MAGGKASGNAARSRKRVEATVLKRSRDGSAFTRCEACNKDVPVVLIDMHSCSLDMKIRETLEATVVEKTVEVAKPADRKKPSSAKGKAGGAGNKDGKRKRSTTAFFLFMDDFRKEYKAAHPDNKSVATVGKEAGAKWKSMTEEEKKPYVEKAAELKAQAENGEGSGENDVAKKKAKADDEDGDQEVDQPAKKRIRNKAQDEAEDDAGQQEDEDDKNELDDDLDDDM